MSEALFPAADLEQLQTIRRGLPAFATHALTCMGETVSTNDDVKKGWGRLPPPPTILVAGHQTGGRGQFGRSWLDCPPTGTSLPPALLFSFSWCLPTAQVPRLALPILTGIALYRAVIALGASPDACWLKWPNDLIGPGGKLAGILAESTSDASLTAFVIGIGINLSGDLIRQFPHLGASSLEAIGVVTRPLPLLATFLQAWDHLWSTLDEPHLLEEFTRAAGPFFRRPARYLRPECPDGTPVTIDRLDESGGLWIRGKEIGRRLIVDARNLLPG